MNETKLTKRQSLILNLVNQSQGISRVQVEGRVGDLYPSSKPTIARDLAFLVHHQAIKISGVGRSIQYHPIADNPLLRYFDLEWYFSFDPDKRVGAKRLFDFTVFDNLHDLFLPQELIELESMKKSFTQATTHLSREILHKELERFVVELAWKSSKIEGNTYSLLETEALIKQNQEAVGHSREEAVMILNHKAAFNNILANKDDYQTLNLALLTQLHNFIVKGLAITPGIRKQAVGITGTVYKPLDNQWQIQEVVERLLTALNDTRNPLEKALITTAMISYIQPFSDGNKRTGRMLTNAILLAHDYFPLSYRSVDETDFKKALILFYEQNSLYHLKQIVIGQYKFALETYFQSKE